MRSASLWFLGLVAAASCSVPATRFGRRVSDVKKKLAEAEAALAKEEFTTAVSRANETTKLGSELASESKILLGDPRREKIDKALARAREIRDEVGRHRERWAEASHRRLVESSARAAFLEGAASTEEVKGPPEVATLAGSEAGFGAGAGGTLGGDEDFDRQRTIDVGDRAGDITDEPEKDKPKTSGMEKPPDRLQIDENTPAIVIRKRPVTKGKGVALYFTFVNKNPGTQIGSVTGEFIRENGKVAAPIISTFKAEGFRPDWDSIFDSKGEAVTAGQVWVGQMEGIQLVCICEKPQVGDVTSAKIVVTTLDGRTVRGKGPPE